MAYLVVENFSAGLDTRRHPLTARPGTLQKLKNAHVSRGGEIEKRKAFEVINTLGPAFTHPFHGLQATSDKIYTFTGGWDSQTGNKELQVGTSNLYAMLLIHPSYTLGNYNGNMLPTLDGVIYSTMYGGKVFVLARFNNGDVIPYYDGEFLSDFYVGKTRGWMTSVSPNPWDVFCSTLAWQIRGGSFGLSSTGWDADSSNLPAGAQSWVDVTAPPDVDFTPSATADEGITITTSTITEYKAGIAATKASGGFSVTSGTLGTPAGYVKGLRYIGATPKIMNIYFDEEEAIDEPGGWTGFDWNTQAVGSTAAVGLAYNIKWHLDNFKRNRDGIANTPVGAGIYTYQGFRRGSPIGYINLFVPNTTGSYFDDHAANNGKDIEIEFDADPRNVAGIAELIDPATIEPSGFVAGRYTAKFASMAGGITNAISQVLVDGVDVMGAPIKWMNSHSDTMSRIVEQINAFNSSPEYTASYSNDKVTLTSVNTGADQNGRVIEVNVTGNIKTAGYSSFTGGADSIAPVRKRVRYSFSSGTFYPDKSVTLIATKVLDPANPIYWGASRVTDAKPTSALTFKTKAHIGSGSTMFFSAVNNPKKWGQDGVGAGFINMSNSSGGNEAVNALATYQGNLAAFSRRTVQIWSIDTDPANNRQGQVLSNTGAFGPRSVVSVGDIDVFYLSDSGIRSLRARDSSNAAVVNDVGTPVDGLILNDISDMTFDQKAACPAVIEPVDGRYWIAIGDKIYVYSYFPSSQVAAWSTYEPGRTFTDFTTKDGKIYAKEGQYVYVYGGENGHTYDDSQVEVILPYLDGGKPAHAKTLMGLDMTCEGEWSVEIGMDPVNPDARDVVATVSQPTFTLGRIQANGSGTHVGVRLVNDAPGYARLANLICHFEFNESE